MEATRFSQDRRRLILDEVRLCGSVSVGDLAGQLGVSVETARRDINALAAQGLVNRVHGGAIARRGVDRPAHATLPTLIGKRKVGIVTPSTDYFWPKVVNGVQLAANNYRGQVTLRESSYRVEDDRLQTQRLVENGQIEGLLVAPAPTKKESSQMLAWLDAFDLPVVLMERTVPEQMLSGRLEWVVTDQVHSTEVALHYLTDLGHRRIGLLAAAGKPLFGAATDAWSRVARTFGLDMTGVVCEQTEAFMATDRESQLDGLIERLLSSGTTAVIVHSDAEAIMLLQRCQELKVRVPGELSLISYDDEIAALSDPPLTAIRPPKRQIGYEAASLLFRRLADPAMPVHRLLLTSQLEVRSTTGAPSRR
ncbi:MAG: substrate-binding domain-containing protein [Propionibacteriaceae bacterium]|nr:substrate-binding domain-containing protein [Propionibacteriaceae bacterium]